jgi:hypothetical protein
LEADHERIGAVNALGLDELFILRFGPHHWHYFSFQIVDVRTGCRSTSSLVGEVWGA